MVRCLETSQDEKFSEDTMKKGLHFLKLFIHNDLWFPFLFATPNLPQMKKVKPQVIQRAIVSRYAHNFLLPVSYPQNNPPQIIVLHYCRPFLLTHI
jgi:hypothetical protein